MKKFITVVAHQEPEYLQKAFYRPFYEGLPEYGFATRYPIIPIIADSIEDGEEFRLVTIKATGDSDEKNSWLADNHQALIEDLNAVRDHAGIDFTFDEKVIETPYESSGEDLSKLTSAILDSVDSGDQVYACITYGEKTDTLAIFQALNQIYTDSLAGRNVQLVECAYGQCIPGPPKEDGCKNGVLKSMMDFLLRPLELNEANVDDGAQGDAYGWRDAGAHRKHFMTCISLASEKNFKPEQYYDESGQVKLGDPIRYPIIPCMNAVIEDGEEVTLTTISFTGDERTKLTMECNIGYLDSEIEGIKAKRGIDFSVNRTTATVPYSSSNTDLIGLCDDLVGVVRDGDELYVCVTFGEKGIAVAFQQALASVLLRRLGNVHVALCVYGYYARAEDAKSKLHDVTSYVMDGAIELALRQSDSTDPGAVRRVLRTSIEEEE